MTDPDRLKADACPRWIVDADGNILGSVSFPVQVGGGVYLATAEGGALTVTDENVLVTLREEHYQVYKGSTWHASYLMPHNSPLADDASLTLALQTFERQLHIEARGSVGGDFEGYMYEGAEWAGGTQITPYNKHRAATTTPGAMVWVDPVVSNVGTLIESRFGPGGSGPQSVGASAATRDEWVLKRNEKYLFRLTNRAGTTQQASMMLEWYED